MFWMETEILHELYEGKTKRKIKDCIYKNIWICLFKW